jgi:DNA-binding MarR family transcriptional regulator
LTSCGQTNAKTSDDNSDLESGVIECLNVEYEKSDVELEEVRQIFESYFAKGGITKASDTKAKQYQDILNFWERPTMQFPMFEDKSKVAEMAQRLSLNQADIMQKNQLRCLANIYEENEATIDTLSSLATFGAILSTVKQVPNVSPGLIAGGLNLAMQKDDLDKELYQNAIALMYLFDMSLFLTDGKN